MSDAMQICGIDGTTGRPILGDGQAEEIADAGMRSGGAAPLGRGLAHRGFRAPYGVHPEDLGSVGWCVIFAHDADLKIIRALRPLLDFRRNQARGGAHDLYKEFAGPKGYRPGESALDFLGRSQVGVGLPEISKVPYYVLIVGGPGEIPFRFQYDLDAQYAVGRIHFDSAEDYGNYARKVVAAESPRDGDGRGVTFFGPKIPGDRATKDSADTLVVPLHDWLKGEAQEWAVEKHVGQAANKERLGRLLGGEETPAFLFTASHGLAFPAGEPRRLAEQGAILCQDWTMTAGPVDGKAYFAARDVPADSKPGGRIVFNFACFSAGTPSASDFLDPVLSHLPYLGPGAFVAALPKRLLAQPVGGALAVVGHVDVAWASAYRSGAGGAQLGHFQEMFRKLLAGVPIGDALDGFNARYADIAVQMQGLAAEIAAHPGAGEAEGEPVEGGGLASLARRLWSALQGKPAARGPADEGRRRGTDQLRRLWATGYDARSYILLGDPAVRLRPRI